MLLENKSAGGVINSFTCTLADTSRRDAVGNRQTRADSASDRDTDKEPEVAIRADIGNKIWLNLGSAADVRVGRESQELLTLLNRQPDGVRALTTRDYSK